jgi:cytochrome c-type biogenesis protein
MDLLAAIEFGPGALAAAFAAGAVSFISSCVLPLVPGYLSIVSGAGVDELGAQPRRVASSTAAFVLGFGAIFVLLGAGAAWFGDVLLANRRTLEIVAGILIVFAGLVYAGVRVPLAVLREKRLASARTGRIPTAALAGLAFGIGWTPCIGPRWRPSSRSQPDRGAPARAPSCSPSTRSGSGFRSCSSASASRALGVVGVLGRHRALVGRASGSLLVVFGVLLASGYLARLTRSLAQFTGLAI